MWKSILILTLAAVLIPAPADAAGTRNKTEPTPAATEAAPVPSLRFEPALARVDKKAAALFGAESQQKLRLLAEAAVLTDYCAAINLDQQKFKQEFEALATANAGQRKASEQRDYDYKLSMYFGVYVGLLVAEGNERKAEFCGFAESALKEQRPISRFWIATATPPIPPKP